MTPKCPICDRAALPREQNRSFPFCSARCKTIDLGKWLSEDYRIPVEGDPSESGGGGEREGDDANADEGSKSRADVRH